MPHPGPWLLRDALAELWSLTPLCASAKGLTGPKGKQAARCKQQYFTDRDQSAKTLSIDAGKPSLDEMTTATRVGRNIDRKCL